MKKNKILDGITVLDLTRVVAGPSCTRALADMGAEVIKVEPPGGDMWRRGQPRVGGVSVGFAQLNVGKRFVSVDMNDARGKQLVFNLALQADVVIENFRPGVAERLGLGYGKLKAEKPDIIYCSISGYGQSGASAKRRAYAPIIHAEMGLLHQNAREWGTEPLPESVSHVDFAVGSQAAMGILAALYHLQRTGEGQYIDASMAETMLAMNEATAIEVNGGVGERMSPFRPAKAAVVKVGNGDWAQLPGNPATQVFQVGKVLGRLGELQAKGWSGPESVYGNEKAAVEILRSWALEFDTIELLESALDVAKIPVGKVRPLAETIDTEWARERAAFVNVECGGGSINVPYSPLRFSGTGVGPSGGAYYQGSDNSKVLTEKLGLTDGEIEELKSGGILVEFQLEYSNTYS
jgi:CoA:oxalate CoA-transferase